jgi:hypothetical protein
MAVLSVEVRISVAWWVVPYIHGVNLFSKLTGLSPDIDKCVAFAMRGVKAEVIG